jgi:nickel/cobalt transporter (NiCoT) family protein
MSTHNDSQVIEPSNQNGELEPLQELAFGGFTDLTGFKRKAQVYHERTPYLRALPFAAISIIAILIAVNVAVWIAVGIVLVSPTPELCKPVTGGILGFKARS